MGTGRGFLILLREFDSTPFRRWYYNGFGFRVQGCTSNFYVEDSCIKKHGTPNLNPEPLTLFP